MFRQNQCRLIKFDMGEVTHPEFNQTVKLSGALLCPLSSPKNPHIAEAHEKSIAWAMAFGLVDAKGIEILKAANFAGLFASCLRAKPVQDLEIMTEYSAFLFILDDILDKQAESLGEAVVKSALVTFGKLFAGDYTSFSQVEKIDFPLFENLCRSVIDLRERLVDKGVDLTHFVSSVKHTLNATIWGTNGGFRNMSEEGIVLSRESYLQMRQATGAVETIFELACVLNGLNVSETARENLTVQRVSVAANHIICLLNDIVSLNKEIEEKNRENFIQTLLFTKQDLGLKVSLENAIKQAIQFHNIQVFDFLSWKKFIPDEEGVEQYCAMLQDCINDNLEWSLKGTKRYSPVLAWKSENEMTLEEYHQLLTYQKKIKEVEKVYKVTANAAYH